MRHRQFPQNSSLSASPASLTPSASWLGTYCNAAWNPNLLWTPQRAWCMNPNFCLGKTALIPETQTQQKFKF